jgi:hypothetical protein
MHFTTLARVRQQMYACFAQSAGSLFNLCDALSSESSAQSLAELSLSPCFARKWPSVYEALQDGHINEEAWRLLWADALIAPGEGVIWLEIASSSIPRQVRRVAPGLLAQLGTPAPAPKPRGKSPSWPKGRPRTQPARCAVVRKLKPAPKSQRKSASQRLVSVYHAAFPTFLRSQP